jgi:hypothetical protein
MARKRFTFECDVEKMAAVLRDRQTIDEEMDGEELPDDELIEKSLPQYMAFLDYRLQRDEVGKKNAATDLTICEHKATGAVIP